MAAVADKHDDKKPSAAWQELTRRYLHDLPQQLDTMCHALEEGDFAGLQACAHRAKGTSGTYRLEAIASQFALIEQQASAAHRQDLETYLAALRGRIQQTAMHFSQSQLVEPGEAHD